MISSYPVKIKKSQLIEYPAALADKQVTNGCSHATDERSDSEVT